MLVLLKILKEDCTHYRFVLAHVLHKCHILKSCCHLLAAAESSCSGRTLLYVRQAGVSRMTAFCVCQQVLRNIYDIAIVISV